MFSALDGGAATGATAFNSPSNCLNARASSLWRRTPTLAKIARSWARTVNTDSPKAAAASFSVTPSSMCCASRASAGVSEKVAWMALHFSRPSRSGLTSRIAQPSPNGVSVRLAHTSGSRSALTSTPKRRRPSLSDRSTKAACNPRFRVRRASRSDRPAALSSAATPAARACPSRLAPRVRPSPLIATAAMVSGSSAAPALRISRHTSSNVAGSSASPSRATQSSSLVQSSTSSAWRKACASALASRSRSATAPVKPRHPHAQLHNRNHITQI